MELVTKCDRFKNMKYSSVLPIAFTEHEAITADGVLNSPRAVQTSVLVVRAFFRMREMLAANAELVARISELENRGQDHDRSRSSVVAAIGRLAEPEARPSRRIGFGAEGEGREVVAADADPLRSHRSGEIKPRLVSAGSEWCEREDSNLHGVAPTGT